MVRRAICILLASLSLAACTQGDRLFAQSESDEEWKAKVAARPPLYCYRTLAAADCYLEPRLGETNRLIGYEATVPPPQ